MSTLVIIAHVKDGADLARQNKIPEPIIDFIQQHHGTTLVEYFYRQASESKKADPNGSEVDESSFRYPGPKPQTKEAGILMLADAVESASRVLVEPTPSRIESLVEDISRKRLLRRPIRRMRPDAGRSSQDRRQSRKIADRGVPRPREVSGPGNGVKQSSLPAGDNR